MADDKAARAFNKEDFKELIEKHISNGDDGENRQELKKLVRYLSGVTRKQLDVPGLPCWNDTTIRKGTIGKMLRFLQQFCDAFYEQRDVLEMDGLFTDDEREDEALNRSEDDSVTTLASRSAATKEDKQMQMMMEFFKEQTRQQQEQHRQLIEVILQRNNTGNYTRPAPQQQSVDRQGPPVNPFSGEGTRGQKKDFSTWLTQYEECSDMFNYDRRTKLFWLKQKMIGSAQSFVESQNEEVKANYDQLVIVLSSYFKDTTSITMRYKEAFNCAQDTKANESISEFRERISDKFRKAEKLAPLTSDVAKKHVFLLGVEDQYKADLISRCDDNTTFEQLCELAVGLEQQRGDLRNLKNISGYGYQHGPTEGARQNNGYQQLRRVFQPPAPAQQMRRPTTTVLSTTTRPCIFCQGQHRESNCTTYTTVESRMDLVRREKRCFNCLMDTHGIATCRNYKTCMQCKGRHHTSLCNTGRPGQQAVMTINSEQQGESSEGEQESEPAHVVSCLTHGEEVVLQMAVTKISNPDKELTTQVRLLFDNGSQRSFITDSIAEKLQLQSKETSTLSISSFGVKKPLTLVSDVVEFKVHLCDGTALKIAANKTPVITTPVQRSTHVAAVLEGIRGFSLAEPYPAGAQQVTIDVLIGMDHYYDFIGIQRVQIANRLWLVQSSLGWVPAGKVPSSNKISQATMMLSISQLHQHDAAMERLWSLEGIGISGSANDNDDDRVLREFNNKIQANQTADNKVRYEVSWPWKFPKEELPINYNLSMRRLKSTYQRLMKQPELLKMYDKSIQEWKGKNIIEEVPTNEEFSCGRHYLPHHGVVDMKRATTKVRVVHDASAKPNKEAPSLNESLYRGPVLLSNLCGLLIRFRLKPVVVLSDIEKAFLQVGLSKADRDVTRFIWLHNYEKGIRRDNLVTYRFARVPFGVISSPFLLCATVAYHLKKNEAAVPVASEILNNIYVDNVLIGKRTVEESIDYYKSAKDLFNKASMNLREWMSNSKGFMQSIPEEDRAKGKQIKVLGLQWDVNEDKIHLKDPELQGVKCFTKLEALRSLASLFDPLGYFNPVTLRGKLMIQQHWKDKLNWNDRLSHDQETQWQEIVQDYSQIAQIKVTRCVNPTGYEVSKLHCFVDASKMAYSAAVYAEVVGVDGKKETHLMMSKTRLAPIDAKITIPRLELMAMTIGSRLLDFVAQQLQQKMPTLYLWSDSQCVLGWVKNNRPLETFVQNRVNEIVSRKGVQINYISTIHNPADLATRPADLASISKSALWWHGPDWLKHQSVWPVRDNDNAPPHPATMTQLMTNTNTTRIIEEPCLSWYRPMSLSSSIFAERVLAWVFLFVRRCQREQVEFDLSQGRRWLQRMVQEKHYPTIWRALKSQENRGGKVLCGTDKLFVNQLGIYYDRHLQLLRCRGRINNADVSDLTSEPILLPEKCHYTRQLIQRVHEQIGHTRTQHTLSSLREHYWIPSGRGVVNQVLRSCRTCRRWEGGTYDVPEAPQLPGERVRRRPAFSAVGVDYLGPTYIRGSSQIAEKVWICLFSCMVTRAIHLELSKGMTGKEFLLCLKRFVSRRGVPEIIYSDNAKQFGSTDKLVREMTNKSEDADRTQWKFIPERAPWMGGFYERLVQSVKRCLRKMLPRRGLLNYTELETAVTEVEAIVNTRPITYVGTSLEERPLRPIDLIVGQVKISLPATTKEEDDGDVDYLPLKSDYSSLATIQKQQEKMLNVFWTSWQKDYLLSLRERHARDKKKMKQIREEPKIGDVVLMKSDGPRSTWKLARINGFAASCDGKRRTAYVESVSSDGNSRRRFVRAIRDLYPLEVSSSTSEQNLVAGVSPSEDRTAG